MPERSEDLNALPALRRCGSGLLYNVYIGAYEGGRRGRESTKGTHIQTKRVDDNYRAARNREGTNRLKPKRTTTTRVGGLRPSDTFCHLFVIRAAL